jgi:Ni,Fe-hydrogenase III small subunit
LDVLFSPRYDVHRYEANYANHYRHVDYDADYLRFGRVEKPLDK